MSSPSHNYIRLSAVSILSAAVLALAGCSEEKAETKEIVRPVKVVEIAAIDTSRTLSYSGTVPAPR
jgi:multidrug efflux system membrane fusion protein